MHGTSYKYFIKHSFSPSEVTGATPFLGGRCSATVFAARS